VVNGRRNLRHQIGQTDLVAIALSFEVKVRPVEVLGLNGRDERLRQGGGSSGR